jgi:RimJ/RimL family protein N-acetyltransferase
MLESDLPRLVFSHRVYLTPLTTMHAPALTRWFNDPDIWGHQRDISIVSTIEQQLTWIQQVQKDDTFRLYAIYLKQGNVLIGNGGFSHFNAEDRTAEVGLVLGEKQYHGRGLGSECLWLLCKFGFEVLKLHNILAENYADNPIAIHNARKVGFRYYGTRRQSRRIGARVLDVRYSDMLPHELIAPPQRD